nr:hypothetical protein [Tanacetum cinerariifolium]
MRTRSSSNPPVVSPPNPSTSNPNCRNHRRSKQPFILEESPVDTMADQRTMAELLRAPTEGGSPPVARKRTPRSILTWEDLVSKFINEFFPPSRTTNLRNEISNFQQRFDKSFHEAWNRYKDLIRACPHHGFTELHQLDTFYNALNPADQDSFNAAAGGNMLERRTQDVLTIIENKSKFQATPPPASVKAIEEICVTCDGAHLYYQCLIAGGNTFPELRDNIQGYVAAAAVNYNQELRDNIQGCVAAAAVNYNQASISNQTNELKNMMASVFQMNTASTLGSRHLPSNTIANSKGELKAITTRSGIVLDGPFVLIPPPFINLEEDECVEETLTDQDLAEYTIKVITPHVLGSFMT